MHACGLTMDAPLFDVTSTSNWWAIFAALFVAALALRFAPSANKSAKDDKPIDATAAIGAVPGAASLKARYLAVFLALKFADWMQGPYFFSVYAFIYAQQHVGGNDGDSSDQAAVRKLVAVTQVVGFVSGAVFGSFAGAVADKMGRKKAAAFGALCAAVSCSTAAAGHTLPIAAVVAGRVAGGVASSLQYSALEAWLTSEVKSLDFKGSGDDAGAWTSRVFALQGFSDGISAVIAGVVAEQLNSMYGPQGPYAAAAVLAGLVCIAALTLWSENYGGHAKEAGKKDEGGSAMGNMGSALSLIFTDKIIGLQGLAQSLFEGSMFCFVMIWVPSLSAAVTASGTTGDVPLGLIFSCFMACIMIGSALFGFLADRGLATETILKVRCGHLARVTFPCTADQMLTLPPLCL